MKKAMKRYIRLLFLFLLPWLSQAVAAQELPEECRQAGGAFEQHLSGQVIREFPLTTGSQYFMEEWLPGQVLLSSGMTSPTSLLRYNGYLDQMFWLDTVRYNQVMLDRGLVLEVRMRNSRGREPFVFRKIWVSVPPVGIRKEVYAQVLVDDSISLYCHRNIVYRRMAYTRVENMNYERPLIEPEYRYYILIPGEESVSFTRITRRMLYSFFPDRKTALREFIHRNNIRLKKEDDLVYLFTFLNQ